MRKNNLTLVIFLLVGLLIGSILSELLTSVPGLSFLTKYAAISWEPAADLNIVKYDLYFQVKLNLISVLGLIVAFWFYRRL